MTSTNLDGALQRNQPQIIKQNVDGNYNYEEHSE